MNILNINICNLIYKNYGFVDFGGILDDVEKKKID